MLLILIERAGLGLAWFVDHWFGVFFNKNPELRATEHCPFQLRNFIGLFSLAVILFPSVELHQGK